MRIAVVGDVMVDRDILCRAERLCTEAPVAILHHDAEHCRPGGAANVAAMLAALDIDVLLAGVVGDDVEAEWLRTWAQSTARVALYVVQDGRPTTRKDRIFDTREHRRHLVARVDRESRAPVARNIAHEMAQAVAAYAPDCVIVQDHGKGVITSDLLEAMPPCPLYIDPVATTPTSRVAIWCGSRSELPADARDVRIEKRGPDGLWLTAPTADAHIPSYCTHVIDPLGAGDQFIAALAVVAARADLVTACRVAARAAAEQCERAGIQPVASDRFGQLVASICG